MGSRKPIQFKIVLIWHNDSTFWKLKKLYIVKY